MTLILAVLLILASAAMAQSPGVSGRVLDPTGKSVPDAIVHLQIQGSDVAQVKSGNTGDFTFEGLIAGRYSLLAESAEFAPATRAFELRMGEMTVADVQFLQIAPKNESILITAKTLEPGIDLRNSEVFNRTLFSRDDQALYQLNAGISAGQHEGGGKSLEIRRFGFNLDHGGVNGGLKVLVDNVQQNQGTQGHGQGYLGSLKAISPELIQDATIVNGPFSPEYGDFSGLGVVHLRQRESMPDEYTARLQGGNFGNRRAFFAWSPLQTKADTYIAYDGSLVDGPFINPGRYRRDNVNANYTRTLSEGQKAGVRLLFGRNDFYSSGQIPLDLVQQGRLDRFGFLDPDQGGKVRLATLSGYYSRATVGGGTWKVDGFISRSLFDLFSNFTYFLNDPVNGDAIQQHDSRLQQGANVQHVRPHHIGSTAATFTGGGNFHDNQINIGLYGRQGRDPFVTTTAGNAHVTNGAGYMQESVTLFHGHVLASGGLRYDRFRYSLLDRIVPEQSGAQGAGRWQAKGSVVITPSDKLPLAFHLNYGRGINSVDARGVIQRPDQPRLAATDFYQFGIASNARRLALSANVFLIDHSNEQVYIPDDGSLEFQGPSRAYGFETKASVQITRHVSFSGNITQMSNAFFRTTSPREYIVRAPRFTADAGLTVADWNGWSGSLRMRAINHYRLDSLDPGILAQGYTVFDFAVSRRMSRNMDLHLGLDNLANRSYWETQNYLESRVTPDAPIIARIHGTPGYPLTATVGMTLRFGGK